MKTFVADSRDKGRADHLLKRLIESKTGGRLEYNRIADLPALWEGVTRSKRISAGYRAMFNAAFSRFIKYMQKANPKAAYLYEVQPKEVNAFVAGLRDTVSPVTCRGYVTILRAAFDAFLPDGVRNPFRDVAIKATTRSGESSIHRQPFTPDELKLVFDASKTDPFMYPLVVTAACTGMRRGDVCRLRWKSIDMASGMLKVKTGKTGADVEIPIFKPLQDVLSEADRKGQFVFPEAAKMIDRNPDGLTWRCKKIIAMALNPAAFVEENISLKDVQKEAHKQLVSKIDDKDRRERVLAHLKAYCEGQSISAIAKDTAHSKGSISNDLHLVEDLTRISHKIIEKGLF